MSGQIASKNFRHELLAVKPSSHGGLQPDDFRRIFGCRQAISQFTQFLACQLTILCQFDSKLNYFSLLRRGQLFYFFDNWGRCHTVYITNYHNSLQARPAQRSRRDYA